MTRDRVDAKFFDTTLLPGASHTLELNTQRADRVLLIIDNGSSGERADKYDLLVSVDQDVGFGFQEVPSLSKLQTQNISHTSRAYGRYMRFQIRHEGNKESRVRVVVESMRSI